jgi:hypothetical protein|eukprot:COSAG02_NODE_1220_length_13807_cov_6.303254_9_plen_39_part_00
MASLDRIIQHRLRHTGSQSLSGSHMQEPRLRHLQRTSI